ncbi:DEKNAAC103202 [Brettanomyces naardenensis]|uniref:DEKNAAC103202 n=1 Tax=Brettanomyces naardenensis TaxID=13370 RepID=A0A448YMP4_BRENA|nr:DEKNAAC103202 [Brettanomyces naardenensis]
MDTQYILSRAESYDQFDERSAAKRICDWGKKNGGLDGYVRLEIGFELVICDFHDKLGLVSNVSLSNLTETLHFLPERPDDGSDPLNLQRSLVIDNLDAMAGFEWLESGARVYGGDSRILLDFSKFVTPIGQTYIDPDPYKRRIYNVSTQLKEKMIDGVANILSTPNDPYQKTDWRQITEGIEKKFGPILMGLNNSFTMYDSHKDSGILGQNLTTYTFNFVRRYLVEPDYNLTPSSKKMAVWDYVHPYKPLTTEPELLIFSSITVVQARIVDMMDSVFQLGRSLLSVYGGKGVDSEYAERHTESIREEVKALLDELNWPVIYGCRNACKSDEICLVPTWGPSPMGWGGRGIGFNEGADGITRINRDFTCVSYRKLLE